mmetsp:Transcript_31215/g.90137  ORF Transcript_31215/g.90137 Transcript_31215/m.90137 type:complete len:241 (+) Transcript_31215:3140-3862(+)
MPHQRRLVGYAPTTAGRDAGVLRRPTVHLATADGRPQPPAAALEAVPAIPVIEPDGRIVNFLVVGSLLEEGLLAMVHALLNVLTNQLLHVSDSITLEFGCKHQGLYLCWPLGGRNSCGKGPLLLVSFTGALPFLVHLVLVSVLRLAQHVLLSRPIYGTLPAVLGRLRCRALVPRPDLAAADALADPPAGELLAISGIPEEERELWECSAAGLPLALVDAPPMVRPCDDELPQHGVRGGRQ